MVQCASWTCSRHSSCRFFARRHMLAIAGPIPVRPHRLWMGSADCRLHLHWSSRTFLLSARVEIFYFEFGSKHKAEIGFCRHIKGLEIYRVFCRNVPCPMGNVHSLLLFTDLRPILWDERKQGQRLTFIPERGFLRGPNPHWNCGG